MLRIQHFNDKYADDAYDDIEVTAMRDNTDPVAERRCNAQMLITIFAMVVLTISLIADGPRPHLEVGVKEKYYGSDSTYQSNLRPYGSEMRDDLGAEEPLEKDTPWKDKPTLEVNEEVTSDIDKTEKGDIYQSNLPPYGSELRDNLPEEPLEEDKPTLEGNKEDISGIDDKGKDDQLFQTNDVTPSERESTKDVRDKYPNEQEFNDALEFTEDVEGSNTDEGKKEIYELEEDVKIEVDEVSLEKNPSSAPDKKKGNSILDHIWGAKDSPESDEVDGSEEEEEFESDEATGLNGSEEDVGKDVGSDLFGPSDYGEEKEELVVTTAVTDEEMVLVACGATTGTCSGQSSIVPKASEYAVRCCIDGVQPWSAKEWKSAGGACGKTHGGSFISNVCYQRKTFESAAEICRSVWGPRQSQARMCTRAEIENNCAQSSGCGMDNGMVWVSDVVTVGTTEAPVIDQTAVTDEEMTLVGTEYPDQQVGQEDEKYVYPDNQQQVKEEGAFNYPATPEVEEYEYVYPDNQQQVKDEGAFNYPATPEVEEDGTKYPEFLVEEEEDPLYPKQDNPLYPYGNGGSTPNEPSPPASEAHDKEIYPPANENQDTEYQPSVNKHDTEQYPPPQVEEPVEDLAADEDMFMPLEYKFGDLEKPYVPGLDFPFLWYIPRTAGTSVETMLTKCHKMVAAGNKGAIGGKATKPVSFHHVFGILVLVVLKARTHTSIHPSTDSIWKLLNHTLEKILLTLNSELLKVSSEQSTWM